MMPRERAEFEHKANTRERQAEDERSSDANVIDTHALSAPVNGSIANINKLILAELERC